LSELRRSLIASTRPDDLVEINSGRWFVLISGRMAASRCML